MELAKIHFANDEDLNLTISERIEEVARIYKDNLSHLDWSVGRWLQFLYVYTKPNRLEFVFQSSSNFIAIVVPMNCLFTNSHGVDVEFIYNAITCNYGDLYEYFRDEKLKHLKDEWVD